MTYVKPKTARMCTFITAATLACPLLAGCVATYEGSFTRTGGPTQAPEAAPIACASGDGRGFFGVDVTVGTADQSRASLIRIVDDPMNGKVVRMYEQGEHTAYVDYRPSSCRVFDLTIKRHGMLKNGVRAMGGHVALDCDGPDGTRVVGHGDFDWCGN